MAVEKVSLIEPKCVHIDATPMTVFDKLVIIHVGKGFKKKEFQVHRGLLRHYSIYFRSVLRDGYKDDIELVDDDPDMFDILVYWMYTRRFWAKGTSADGKIPLTWERVFALFFFAQSKGMQELQNAAITLVYQRAVQLWEFPSQHVTETYGKTSSPSPLRQFLVDFYAEVCDPQIIDGRKDTICKDFLVDLLWAFKSLRRSPGIMCPPKDQYVAKYNQIFCQKYHVHTVDTGPT